MNKLEKIDQIFRVKYNPENNYVGLQFENRRQRIWISKFDWFDLRSAIILEMTGNIEDTYPTEQHPTNGDQVGGMK